MGLFVAFSDIYQKECLPQKESANLMRLSLTCLAGRQLIVWNFMVSYRVLWNWTLWAIKCVNCGVLIMLFMQIVLSVERLLAYYLIIEFY